MAGMRDECLVTLKIVLVCHSEQRRTCEPFQGKTCTLLVKVSKLHMYCVCTYSTSIVFQEYLTCIFTFTIYTYRCLVQKSPQVLQLVSPERLMFWTAWQCPAENLQLSVEHQNRAKPQSWSPWHPNQSPRYSVLLKYKYSPFLWVHPSCLTP